jgi:hypothetical protein
VHGAVDREEERSGEHRRHLLAVPDVQRDGLVGELASTALLGYPSDSRKVGE